MSVTAKPTHYDVTTDANLVETKITLSLVESRPNSSCSGDDVIHPLRFWYETKLYMRLKHREDTRVTRKNSET